MDAFYHPPIVITHFLPHARKRGMNSTQACLPCLPTDGPAVVPQATTPVQAVRLHHAFLVVVYPHPLPKQHRVCLYISSSFFPPCTYQTASSLGIAWLLSSINMPNDVIRQTYDFVTRSLGHLREAFGLGLVLERICREIDA